MVTGDAPATAGIVAHAVAPDGAISPPGQISESFHPEKFAVFAGVLPEDKYNLVKAFQKQGHIVGMCGDGANDAPALRQAQMGIAVSTATDVAKSAAGIVLIEPGLGGIVSAVKEGRVTFQRILTYILNSVTKKILVVLFLAIGLIMTKQAILTPMLMVILLIAGDFLALSVTTDNVRPSLEPNSWHIGKITIAGVVLGICELTFCAIALAIGKYYLALPEDSLRTFRSGTNCFRWAGHFICNSRKRTCVVLSPQQMGSSVVNSRYCSHIYVGVFGNLYDAFVNNCFGWCICSISWIQHPFSRDQTTAIQASPNRLITR